MWSLKFSPQARGPSIGADAKTLMKIGHFRFCLRPWARWRLSVEEGRYIVRNQTQATKRAEQTDRMPLRSFGVVRIRSPFVRVALMADEGQTVALRRLNQGAALVGQGVTPDHGLVARFAWKGCAKAYVATLNKPQTVPLTTRTMRSVSSSASDARTEFFCESSWMA